MLTKNCPTTIVKAGPIEQGILEDNRSYCPNSERREAPNPSAGTPVATLSSWARAGRVTSYPTTTPQLVGLKFWLIGEK